MAISLEQARGEMSWCVGQGNPRAEDSDLLRWADAITAHLTQPAQATDVGARVRKRVDEIEFAISCGKMDAMQTFTQMRQLIPASPTPDKDQR